MRAFTMHPWWFRRLVRPAYHDSWVEAEQNMLADPLERRRIDELGEELAQKGFERPVVLGRDHWWSPLLRVSDGVHRSLAAMRSGMPIAVRYGYDDPGEYAPSDIYRVAVRSSHDPEEDVTGQMMSLASFRCSAGPWVQCDTASGSSETHLDLYLAPHPDLRPLIAAELQERLRTADIDAVVEFLEDRPDE